MKAGILAKLHEELKQPILSERQVVYILVELRKLIEINQDGENYPALKFHCDWVAHPELRGPAAQNIVRLFDRHQKVIDERMAAKPGEGVNPDLRFMAELGPFMTLTNFRNQFNEYLRLQNLNSEIPNEGDQWANFLKYYTRVVEDCPLRCISQGLKNTDAVTLRVVEIKPGGTSNFQLAIEWSWVSKISGIETKNHQFY